MAIVVGAAVVAVALVAGTLFATRDRGGGAPTPTTAVTAVVAPSSTAGATPTTAAASPGRMATAVAAKAADPLSVVVTWAAPADRSALVGYVVVHRPALGSDEPDTHGVDGPATLQTTVNLPDAGPRCFVVQTVYLNGQGVPSEPACT